MGAADSLRDLIRSYYSNAVVDSVPQISSREFGVGDFGRKISSRHLTFRSSGQLNSFLKEKAPFFISYSNARYELPSARTMAEKKLVGADLIYEFDADDIQTECKSLHDSWKCPSCGASGMGSKELCECGSGVKVEQWVCPECLGETKRQTLKLVKVLEGDFGLSSGISINFSGSKGFHTHVRSESIQSLSKNARLELLDYITGTNINLESMGFSFPKKGVPSCPKKESSMGWTAKLFDSAEELFALSNSDEIALLGGGVSSSIADKFIALKDDLSKNFSMGVLPTVKGLSGSKASAFWRSFFMGVAEKESLKVDRQTSVDINKIIRVPNTIHGSTGLIAKEVKLADLASFDPLSETVVFDDKEVMLKDIHAPKFYLNKKWFGPYIEEELSLPSFVAFYLVARGHADFKGG